MSEIDEAGLRRAYQALADPSGGCAPLRRAIEAYLTEPPKPTWPTDESIAAYMGYDEVRDVEILIPEQREAVDADIRAALLADPIIRGAIALRDSYPRSMAPRQSVVDVIDAVNEAGL